MTRCQAPRTIDVPTQISAADLARAQAQADAARLPLLIYLGNIASASLPALLLSAEAAAPAAR